MLFKKNKFSWLITIFILSYSFLNTAYSYEPTNMKEQELIKALGLEKHVEGGYFKQVYKSQDKISLKYGERRSGTSIYFLLEGNDFSAFHRLKSDEIWSFNYGSPLTIYIINEKGALQKIVLGDIAHPVFQVTVKANQWFAAEINEKNSFSLVSCFVSPGFEYEDFELASRQKLAAEFPQHAELIKRLTRKI